MNIMDIVFQHIKSTQDGVKSTTGRQMEQAFNENFDKVKDLLSSIFTVMGAVVTSTDIKQLKVDTSTTPAKVYYTLDDESVESPTWVLLNNLQFKDLAGNPLDNITLKEALDNKTNDTDFQLLKQRVDTAEQDIDDAESNITDLQTLTSSHTLTLQSHQELLDHAVINNDPNKQMLFKYDESRKELSLSVDQGVTWLLINDINTSFDHLVGDITDNKVLTDYIKDQLSHYAPLNDFNTHVSDVDNPHRVTKAQLGLGNVQDIAPIDMPISEAQKQEFDSIKQTRLVNLTVSLPTYKSATISDNTLYFITSHESDY